MMAEVQTLPSFDQVVHSLKPVEPEDEITVKPPVTPAKLGKTPTKVERLCAVCGDRATGCHYKCWTCEGCKGFFRRTIHKNQVYTCEWDNNCIIDKLTRTQCQKCRFDKCISVGMIAYSSIGFSDKRMAKRLGTDNPIQIAKEDIATIDASVNGLLSHICRAYRECFSRIFYCKVQQINAVNGVISHQHFTQLLSPTMNKILTFVRSLPQFNTFSPNDQTSLLFASCLEILYLRLAMRYDVTRQAFPLNEQNVLTISTVQNVPELNFLLPIFNCAQRLFPLKLDETEAALLSALWLFQPTRPDLTDPGRVEPMQDILLSLLSRYCRMSSDELRWLNVLMARPPLVKGISVGLQNNIPLLYYSLDNVSAVPVSLVYLLDENIS